MKITQPKPGVIHFRAASQGELCRAFVRLQEFYESPFPGIRGHHFTLDEFKERYAEANGGVFSYFEDWNGFNVPGHVVRGFLYIFRADLTADEIAIREAVQGLPKFYVIGTHGEDKGGEEDCEAHELAHARYYLDPDYYARANMAIAAFHAESPELCAKLRALLTEWGYCADVMADEFNAYLATTDLAWWIKETDEATGRALFAAGEPFRLVFA